MSFEFDPDFLAKVEALRAAGVHPWPNGLPVTHTTAQVRAAFGELPPDSRRDDVDLSVGGRVVYRNRMGKALFLRIQDRAGKLQVYLRREEVGDATFDLLKGLDIGDFVWARGFVMTTRTGELSVQAREARLAGKTMLPFPDRWHGVTDVEQRSASALRRPVHERGHPRHVPLRSRMVRWIRDFFEAATTSRSRPR
jgi:lysyl-tRNA synthetase class 2